PAAEPELSHAVADLDSPPTEGVAPPDVSPAAPPAAVEQAETARRRSTVREPAPSAGGEARGNDPVGRAACQGTEPVITETGETSEGQRPRRTGWWSRRFG